MNENTLPGSRAAVVAIETADTACAPSVQRWSWSAKEEKARQISEIKARLASRLEAFLST